MDDLISRKDVLHELDWCDYGLKDWQKWKLKMMVRDIPLAQPEIIRCKDCKYYVIHTMFGRSEGWCERNCDEVDKLLAYVTELDDFCSRAERKEDKNKEDIEEDIEKAIEELRKQYEYAKENLFVYDPMAYALYKTWKKFDEKRLKRDDYERGEA